jgi:hypothetical protein
LPYLELENTCAPPAQAFHPQRQGSRAAAAFQPGPRGRPDRTQQHIAVLQQKLQTNNVVLAELVEEYIALKVSLNQ